MAWDQLLAIEEAARVERREWESARPVDCPIDGTALETGPSGAPHCPHDGWVWTGPGREDGAVC